MILELNNAYNYETIIITTILISCFSEDTFEFYNIKKKLCLQIHRKNSNTSISFSLLDHMTGRTYCELIGQRSD